MNNLHERLVFKKGKQKEFLKKYIEYKGLSSQKELANLLSMKRETLRNWVNEYLTLPAHVFKEICSEFKEGKKFQDFIIAHLPSNWGSKKGGNIRKKQIKDITEYYKQLRVKKEKKRIDYHVSLKKKENITNAVVLKLIKEKIKVKYLLATYVLTDGSLSEKGDHYRISFYTKDGCLKDIVYQMLLIESAYVPYLRKDKHGVYMIRVTDNLLAKKLLEINPCYKKIPKRGQDSEDYLREEQPSLEFMKKLNKKTREWCVRLAFTTDGSISLAKNGTYTLSLSCYHPTLCKEWMGILNLCGIKSTLIKRKKSWCNVSGIRVARESIPQFLEIGGFIDGVKISRKSKKYKGIEKNKLLKRVAKEVSGP